MKKSSPEQSIRNAYKMLQIKLLQIVFAKLPETIPY
jgi:hypothetical protein